MNKGNLAIVGLGYVGLPLAVLAREKGWKVQGFDINEAKVEAINRGESPLVDEVLARDLKKFPIQASTDSRVAAAADVIVVAVPTPVTKEKLPDLTPLSSAITALGPHLHAGQTLIVESTINPGVMDEVVLPLLREHSQVHVDKDQVDDALFVVHCPERINPGDPRWNVRNIPRVLGGYSTAGQQKARNFYESVLEAPVKMMGSVTEAEAVKILENTFRDVNIAFINEMARSFAVLNIDIMNVIAGASTKPFAFMPHYPGNGVGGHCISVDPYYMIERGRQVGFDHKFLKLAREINDSMPAYAVSLLERGLAALNLTPQESPVALLGLAYKKDIADLRESPALEIQRLLTRRELPLRVFDPFVPAQSTAASLGEALSGAAAIMLATNHSVFSEKLTPSVLTKHGIKLVIDGKNSLDGDSLAQAGIAYYGIGRTREVR